MLDPKISIIVPCYNQAIYLNECLSSVLKQTFTNWECIIVNDGSPDHTEEVAKLWCKKDIRFKYVFKENGGLSSARNTGIEYAVSELILPLDADDKIGKEYLKLAFLEFDKQNEVSVIYCNAEKFGDEKGEWILPSFSLKKLALDNVIFCSAIFKKEDWKYVGGYDLNMKTGLEDWEFWIALLKNGKKVKRLNYNGFFYRIKSNSMIKNINSNNSKQELFEYLSIKHADFFVAQLGSFQFLQGENMKLKRLNRMNRYFKKQILNNFCEAFLGFSILKK